MFEEEKEAYSTVTLDRTIDVPAQDSYVWRPSKPYNQQHSSGVLWEPELLELTRHGLIGLPALGDTTSIGITLINPSDDDIHVPQGVTIALASNSVSKVTTIRNRTDLATELVKIGQVETLEVNKGEKEAYVTEGEKTFDEQLMATLDNELSPSQQQQMLALLRRNKDLFASNPNDLGHTPRTTHQIDTGEAPPIVCRPYRYSPKDNKFIQAEVQRMLQQQIIRPSNGPWAFPIVLVTKKDGSIRFCVDYRRLNAITKRDAFPLPRIDEIFDALNGATWFSCVDLAAGYWQIGMKEEDKNKTAFTTREGTYEFNVMPFGLMNAPATFQRLMNEIYTGLLWTSVFVYLDDIQVYSRSFDDHLIHLQQALDRIREAGLKLKLKKCEFGKREVAFLGYRTGINGLTTDPDKVQRILQCPAPTNIKELRSFHGLASYYRRFIPNFAKISEPLRKLLKKDTVWQWEKDQQVSFDSLRTALITEPVLAFPDFDKDFILETDASAAGLGAVLSQRKDDGLEHPIHYASRSTNIHEQRLATTTELEATAVMWALEYFRHYVHGKKTIIRTDHQAIQFIFAKGSLRPVPRKFARWITQLSDYDYVITYKLGRANANADALSRPPFAPEVAFDALIALDDERVLRITRLSPEARLPVRSTEEAAGYDLHTLHNVTLEPMETVRINTGIAIQLPEGVYGRIAPRSGLASRHGIDVLAGVIDADYRGALLVLLINLGKNSVTLRAGDRVAQLILEQHLTPDIIEETKLPTTRRGNAGLGSTGLASLQ
jgi:deoxyuridine 5'-triphosphate nucleotidohydrolase